MRPVIHSVLGFDVQKYGLRNVFAAWAAALFLARAFELRCIGLLDPAAAGTLARSLMSGRARPARARPGWQPWPPSSDLHGLWGGIDRSLASHWRTSTRYGYGGGSDSPTRTARRK